LPQLKKNIPVLPPGCRFLAAGCIDIRTTLGLEGKAVIDKGSGISYYRQLIGILRRQIEDGVFKPGDRIPSEKELSFIFQVNRHTVRQALGELAGRGLIYAVRGKGTFVAGKQEEVIDYKISRRTRFTHNVMEIGLMPGARVLKGMVVPAAERVARNLRLETGDRVALLEMLRSINREPFCLSTDFFPALLVPGLLTRLDELTSLYKFLEEQYGMRLTRTSSTFKAAFPGLDDAFVLEIPRNMPVLVVESVMVDQKGAAVQYSITRFRGDRSKVSVGFE